MPEFLNPAETENFRFTLRPSGSPLDAEGDENDYASFLEGSVAAILATSTGDEEDATTVEEDAPVHPRRIFKSKEAPPRGQGLPLRMGPRSRRGSLSGNNGLKVRVPRPPDREDESAFTFSDRFHIDEASFGGSTVQSPKSSPNHSPQDDHKGGGIVSRGAPIAGHGAQQDGQQDVDDASHLQASIASLKLELIKLSSSNSAFASGVGGGSIGHMKSSMGGRSGTANLSISAQRTQTSGQLVGESQRPGSADSTTKGEGTTPPLVVEDIPWDSAASLLAAHLASETSRRQEAIVHWEAEIAAERESCRVRRQEERAKRREAARIEAEGGGAAAEAKAGESGEPSLGDEQLVRSDTEKPGEEAVAGEGDAVASEKPEDAASGTAANAAALAEETPPAEDGSADQADESAAAPPAEEAKADGTGAPPPQEAEGGADESPAVVDQLPADEEAAKPKAEEDTEKVEEPTAAAADPVATEGAHESADPDDAAAAEDNGESEPAAEADAAPNEEEDEAGADATEEAGDAVPVAEGEAEDSPEPQREVVSSSSTSEDKVGSMDDDVFPTIKRPRRRAGTNEDDEELSEEMQKTLFADVEVPAIPAVVEEDYSLASFRAAAFLPNPAFSDATDESLLKHATASGFAVLDGRDAVFWDVRAKKEDEGIWVSLCHIDSEIEGFASGMHDSSSSEMEGGGSGGYKTSQVEHDPSESSSSEAEERRRKAAEEEAANVPPPPLSEFVKNGGSIDKFLEWTCNFVVVWAKMQGITNFDAALLPKCYFAARKSGETRAKLLGI
ncbi:unnamed protein product [Amoebophrya sp. A25]|nr:unnamed protein product [Amoebophrya sp. A25]|eukprot:GSA25T00027325001.1